MLSRPEKALQNITFEAVTAMFCERVEGRTRGGWSGRKITVSSRRLAAVVLSISTVTAAAPDQMFFFSRNSSGFAQRRGLDGGCRPLGARPFLALILTLQQ
ncbi:hypothetical protein FS842_008938 [Serendipita sp. 407]|nr:hypothetical protein FS842_008938 [Serendipita sp. 407]